MSFSEKLHAPLAARPSIVILCALLFLSPIQAQRKSNLQENDTIRISTELVQTDVAVFDRNGRFVEDLRPEHFDLRVNGKTKEILFFERVEAGTVSEEEQLAATRGRAQDEMQASGRSTPLDRGRSLFFYLDDYHLSTGSITRIREVLMDFIDRDMGQNDEVAIFTASGQLGFLQQLTNERSVLRIALDKIHFRNFATPDSDRTPMTEANAHAILRGDRQVLDYFAEQLIKEAGGPRPTRPSPLGSKTRNQFEAAVQARARSIVDHSALLTSRTLSGFDNLLRVSAAVSWRKLIFFVSDGFFLDGQTNSEGTLRRIGDAAARSGTVIYSIDARGLISGAPDAATKIAFDPTGRIVTNEATSVLATQRPLQSLAIQTGGRAFLDSNNLGDGLKEAIQETSTYYLLAWRPDGDEIRGGKYQTIEINVRNQPDLNVRVRHGFFAELFAQPLTASRKTSDGNKKNPAFEALHSLFRTRHLPVAVSGGYTLGSDKGTNTIASIEVDREVLDWPEFSKDQSLELELLAVVIDDQGKAANTLEQSLTINKTTLANRRIVYNHQFQLKPGLYQIRAVVRHEKSGRMGSDMGWIEIPDWKSGSLSLSSLFLGDMDTEAIQTGNLALNANHRFRSDFRLGFLTYIHNPERGVSGPDMALQVQIIRDGQPVITRPLVRIDHNLSADPIPYGGDIEIAGLNAGKYVLQVTVIDRLANKTASQSSRFTVH